MSFQGDALSCSLLLAIEPVIRNMYNNTDIVELKSFRLNMAWSKVLGYANDLTVITKNSNSSVNTVFAEYELNCLGLNLMLTKQKKLT